ncbi:MAG: aldo/keto reductase [candidate division Zixibacteria bacterium]|nr:aldo/keto reductase [candidate division Zixibacteria bacterium]
MSGNTPDYTRRKFLAASAAGLASAGLAGFSPGLVRAQQITEASDEPKKDIIFRQLGSSKLEVPVVSMGAGNCTDPGLIQASFELGVRHFETAANYQFGANEQLVGGVINKMGVRDQVFITTKIYTPAQRRDFDAKQARNKLTNLVDGSLKRLRTDYIDILLIHDVSNREAVNNQAVMEAMAAIKEQQKARVIGLSVHANVAEVIDEVARVGTWEAVQASYNFTMADDTALSDAITKAGKKGVRLIGMKTLAGGGRWPNPETRQSYNSTTIARAAIKWVLHNPYVATVVPAFNNYEHMQEDFAVARDLEYAPEELNFLSDNSIQLGMGFCRQCRTCLASCPRGVDIPTLMRTHMYAAQYTNFYLARATLDEIPSQNSLPACSHCETCVADCAHSVDIARRIDELKVIYT